MNQGTENANGGDGLKFYRTLELIGIDVEIKKKVTHKPYPIAPRPRNEWLRIRAVSFVFIYLDLMCNHPFSTFPMAISQQCCIENEISITQIIICVCRECVMIC